MPGVGGQEARHAVDFGAFFSCADGATPQELLDGGIYNQIAIALKGGAWRRASLVVITRALAGTAAHEQEEVQQSHANTLRVSSHLHVKATTARLSSAISSHLAHLHIKAAPGILGSPATIPAGHVEHHINRTIAATGGRASRQVVESWKSGHLVCNTARAVGTDGDHVALELERVNGNGPIKDMVQERSARDDTFLPFQTSV